MANGRQNREEYEALRRNLKAAIERRSPTAYSIAQKMNSLNVSDPELGPIIEALASRQFSAMAEAQRHFGVAVATKAADQAERAKSPEPPADDSGGAPFAWAGEETKPREAKPNAFKRLADAVDSYQNKLKTLLSLAKKNPMFWYWILIIAGIIIALILFVVILSIVLDKNQMTPHPGGKSQTQAADPIADREFVRKFLALTGDQDVKNEAIAGNNKKLLAQIDGLIAEIRKPENADLPERDQIEQDYLAIRNIAERISPNNSDNAALYDQIIAKLKETRKYLSAPLAAYPGPSTLPLNLAANEMRHSGDLHDCTRWKPFPCPKPGQTQLGHGVFGPRMFRAAKSDADDISPVGKKPRDVKIIATFDGIITKHVSYTSKGFGNQEFIYLIDQTGQYLSVYSHVHLGDNLKEGSSIKVGDEIGYILDSPGHLHFEYYQITKAGLKPLNYTEEHVKECGLDKNPRSATCPNKRRIGDYYWDYLILILQK